MATYAVSDLHGQYDIFEKLLERYAVKKVDSHFSDVHLSYIYYFSFMPSLSAFIR